MIKADLHTHSSFSSDSSEKLFDMAKAALEKGLQTLCLTEHNDFDYPDGEFLLDVTEYEAELFRVKDIFSDKLEILFGIELGLMDYLAEKNSALINQREFDFVIGSSHLVDGEDPYYPEYFSRFGSKNGILRYFESILANIKAFRDFDVYGHLDYVVRYSPEKSYDPLDFREVIEEALRLLVSAGKGIEINTAALAKGLSHPNPHPFILERFKELGGEIITIGSDAHDKTRVAADFDKAEEALKAAGFSYYAVFRKRKPEFLRV